MIKLCREFLVASLTVIVFVFGMSTNVFAISMTEPLFSVGNNLHKISIDEINGLIDENNSSLPDISENSWPPNPTEVLQDEIMSHTFEVSNTDWFLTKEAKIWYVYYVGDIDTLYWESNAGKALSSYASVPDASVMWLLGPALIALGLIGRKKYRTIQR